MTKRQIEKELDRQAVMFEERVRSGQVLSGSIKFADFAEQWIKEYAQKQLRAKTVAQYQALLPRINAAIGHLRLDRIQPYHLISFYNDLSEDGVRKDTKYLCKIDFKAYLKANNLTKVKLAEAAGVNIGVLDSMTKGKNISEPSADKLCAVLHIKRTDLRRWWLHMIVKSFVFSTRNTAISKPPFSGYPVTRRGPCGHNGDARLRPSHGFSVWLRPAPGCLKISDSRHP